MQIRTWILGFAVCVLATAFSSLLACSSDEAPSRAVVNDFFVALRAKNLEKAYGLVGEDWRKSHTPREFVRLMNEDPALANHKSVRLNDRAVCNNDRCAIGGSLEPGPGELSVMVAKEADAYRIVTLSINGAGPITGTTAAPIRRKSGQ